MGRQLLRRCFRQRPTRIGNNNSREKDWHLCQERAGRAHDELDPAESRDSDGRREPYFPRNHFILTTTIVKVICMGTGFHNRFAQAATYVTDLPTSWPAGRPNTRE